jgi:hypothetical protein
MGNNKIYPVPNAHVVSQANPPKSAPKPEPGVADEINRSVEKVLITKATANALGIDLGGNSSNQDRGESLAATIVTGAMNNQTKLLDELNTLNKEMKTEVKEANNAAGTANMALLNMIMENIKESQRKLDEKANAAASAGAPPSSFDSYRQVKAELASLVEDIGVRQAPAPSSQGSADLYLQIELKKLELENQRILSTIQAENMRADRAFQLQLAEFNENKKIRERDFEEKKNFRAEGLQGLGDILGAIGAGIHRDMGGAVPFAEHPQRVAENIVPPGGSNIVGEFQCEICGDTVTIQPGATSARCPNPNCGASYNL